MALLCAGCASTVKEAGKKFDFKPDKIVIGKTTKRDILESYGRPTTSEVRGKYEILIYQYSKESFKHGRTIGMGALSAIPVLGIATLAMDQGVKESDMAREYRVLSVYTALSSGVVKDFY